MRTKTLLLTAALSAAGIATSMAQVYSVNAVGYVNTTLVPGFNLISNPLTATDNTIQTLMSGISGGVPDGTQVFTFNGTGFSASTFSFGAWSPVAVVQANSTPGSGFFVKIPAGGNKTLTFVGEVPQGTLQNPLPVGLSIKSSMVPQTGTAQALGLTAGDGDQLFQFKAATQGYAASTFSFGAWSPALSSLNVGEAFFLKKIAAGSWDRTFSVNQ